MRSVPSTLASGVLITAAVLVVTSCTAPAEPEGDTTIRIGVTALGAEYNPGRAYMYASLNMNGVYDSLLRTNNEGGYDPALASDWELSDDRKTLSFTLRDDVDFVDGVHLTAEGVVTFFETLLATDDYWGLDTLTNRWPVEFEVTGEYTFDVTCPNPLGFDPFYSMTVTQPIASPEAIQDPEAISVEPVGSGPYVIDEVEPDVSLTMVRNPDYWDPSQYPFDTVVLQVFEDDVAALNALKSGQIDSAELSIANAVEAESEGFRIDQAPGRNVVLWFADRGGTLQPAIADVRVRQAINMAFDRDLINETLNQGYGVASSQPWSPAQPEYIDGNDDYYTYDPDQARELLAEAGYADGFELTMPTTSFLGIDQTAPAVQQALSEIGITVTFDEIGDVGTYFERARDGTYPVLLYNEAFVNTVPGFIAADAFWNYLGYVDDTAEDLVQQIRNGTADESADASQELSAYIMEQAWLAPFSAPFNLYASADGFAVDLKAGNSGAPYLHNFQTAG